MRSGVGKSFLIDILRDYISLMYDPENKCLQPVAVAAPTGNYNLKN